MAITYDSMMSYAIPEVTRTLSDTDCILYALGVGFGTEPEHPGHLRYVYEDGLEVLPMMANVVAYPGFWLKDPATGVDWKRVVHGEQALTIHRPIPHGVKLTGKSRIVGIDDKGASFGVFMFTHPRCRRGGDRRSGLYPGTDHAAARRRRLRRKRPPAETRPSAPQACARSPPRSRGPPGGGTRLPPERDRNTLHVDSAVAKAAGFERPILHGMCTMGYAGHAVMAAVCGYDGARVRSMQVRFTAPAWPGETLRTEM